MNRLSNKALDYIQRQAKEFDQTPEEYFRNCELNYVILLGGNEPYLWGTGDPVVYGGIEDAKPDMAEDDILITEEEYLLSI